MFLWLVLGSALLLLSYRCLLRMLLTVPQLLLPLACPL
jgi:hypothetical protein